MHRLPNWRKLIYHATLYEGYFIYYRTSSVRLPKDTFHKGLSNFTIPELSQLLSNPLLKQDTFGNTGWNVPLWCMNIQTEGRTVCHCPKCATWFGIFIHSSPRHRHEKIWEEKRREALFVQLVVKETEASVLQMVITVCFRHAQKLS